MVSDRIASAGVPASLLTIELTEGTALAHPGVALGILQKLRDTGVHLSVDDYGTGYSTMAYLKNLPVTELKIDQDIHRRREQRSPRRRHSAKRNRPRA